MTNRYLNNRMSEVADSCARAVSWIERACADEPALKQDRNNLEVDLCRLRNHAHAASEVLPVKTSVGVFGASQAGKSYLVSTLASSGGGQGLTAEWCGKKISFMQHVNPVGGDREATGIVTRFTGEYQCKNASYPIELKVFNEAEIVKVLINSYFLDINMSSEYMSEHDSIFKDQSAMDSFFASFDSDEYRLADGESSYIHDYDIVDLAEYVRTHSKGSVLYSTEYGPQCSFWSKLRDLAPKLNVKGRCRLFAVLWHDMPAFSCLYMSIVPELDKLKGKGSVFVNTDVLVKEQADGSLMQLEQGTLVNIHSLDDLFADKFHYSVKVALDEKGEDVATIRFPVLAAATVELSFPIPKDSTSGNFDVLDFPGARSRKKADLNIWLKEEGKSGDSEKSATEFIRRGKVGYLIERYCARHEIDVLLCCVNAAMQGEVSELTPYLTEWIEENVGRTPADRAKLDKIPFVGAFSRFDGCFMRDLKKANQADGVKAPSDIKKTITTALEHFNVEWIQNWSNGEPFSQFFFVRRPNVPDSSLCYEMQDGSEVAILDKARPYLDEYKEEIVKDPLMSHVYEFTKYAQSGAPQDTPTVSEVLKPNDGGVTYLASFLDREFGSDFTQGKDRFYEQIVDAAKALRNRIGIYAQEDGDAASRRAKERALSELGHLSQCDKVGGTISFIRRFLEIDEDKARADYLENYSGGSVSNSYRFAHALSIMREENLSSMSSGVFFEVMFENILRGWDKKDRNSASAMPSDKRRHDYGFFLHDDDSIITEKNELKDKFRNLMKYLTLELSKSYTALKVEDAVVKALEPQESPTSKKEEICDGQCARALQIISDFNTYLFVGRRDGSGVERIKPEKSGRELFKEKVGTTNVSLGTQGGESKSRELYIANISSDMVENLNAHFINDYFSVLVDVICVKNTQAKNKFNISMELNREICEILNSIDSAIEEK